MNTSILTIDPGTRFWGISVFHGKEIFVCMVKNLSAKDSSRNRLSEVRRTFLAMCRKYAPDILVIEKPYEFWKDQSRYLDRIIGEIKRLARKNRVKIWELSPREVRMVLCQDQRATKEDLAKAIGQQIPEFGDYLVRIRKNKARWNRMVNSIALGLCFLRR